MDCLQSSKKKGNHWTSLLNILTRLIQVHRRPRFLFFLRITFLTPYPIPVPKAPKVTPRAARTPFFTARFPTALANPTPAPLPTDARADKAPSKAPPVCRRRRLLLTLRMFSVPYTGRIAGHSGSSSIFIGSRDRIRRRDTCYVSPS